MMMMMIHRLIGNATFVLQRKKELQQKLIFLEVRSITNGLMDAWLS
jgi:hypothetical protein